MSHLLMLGLSFAIPIHSPAGPFHSLDLGEVLCTSALTAARSPAGIAMSCPEASLPPCSSPSSASHSPSLPSSLGVPEPRERRVGLAITSTAEHSRSLSLSAWDQLCPFSNLHLVQQEPSLTKLENSTDLWRQTKCVKRSFTAWPLSTTPQLIHLTCVCVHAVR